MPPASSRRDASPRGSRASPIPAWLRSPWVVVSVVLFVAHLWLIRDALQNGDASVYNDQIESRIAGIRTTHIGYMLCGFVAQAVLPFGLERDMNLMCLAFAAAGGAATFLIARSLGASQSVGAMAPLMAFSIHAYLRGAVLSEVDVVACSLILVAVAFRLRGQVIAAGVVFGVAMLITPITALSTPMVVLTSPKARGPLEWPRFLRDVLVFGVVSLAVYTPLVAAFWHDYWYGGRGLLHAPREAWDVHQQVSRSVAFLTSSAGPWLAMAMAAMIAGIVSGSSLSLGAGVALVATGLVGERFLDVPVQLPQLCILAVLVGVLVGRLPTRLLRWSVLVSLWLSTAWPTYGSVADEVRVDVENRETYLAMADQTPEMILGGVADSWDDGLRFERIVYRRTKLGLGLSFRDLRNSGATIGDKRKDYAIWLIGAPPPGIMTPFARNWRREHRTVRGREYEVWLPASTNETR